MLDAFRSVPIVRSVVRAQQLPGVPPHRDTITLDWEDRLRTRARRRSDGGVEFATALPRGTVLRAGDGFLVGDVLVEVVELEEPVLIVEPKTPTEWALFAYQIGNSHQPIMITDTAIVCPVVPGMEGVLRYHNIPFTRAERPFTPVTVTVDHRHSR